MEELRQSRYDMRHSAGNFTLQNIASNLMHSLVDLKKI